MASSSKGKATKPFYNYLDGLGEEYELLKREVDLMAKEIESLKKERDEYKAQVDNIICTRCNKRNMSAPQIGAPSPKATTFKRLFQFRSLHKATTSDSLQAVDLTQMTTRHSTLRTTHIEKLPSVTPTPYSQSVSQAHHSPQPSDSILYLQGSSDSTTGLDSGLKEFGWSITFNNKVEKRLDVQMAHVLSHAKLICSVNFSRDGRYLAAGGENGKAYIYDGERGTLICVLSNLFEEERAVRVVNFSHDGMYLATCSWDGGNLYIWEIKTEYLRNTFTGHTDFIRSLDFSPNGRYLVSASYDNTVRLWNIRDGTGKLLIEDDPTFIDEPHYRSAVFSPDGKYIAASHRDGTVRIWRVRTRQLIRRVQAHLDFVNGIAFMPDGKGLWSGCSDKTLKYWDISALYDTRDNSEVEEHTQLEQPFLEHERAIHALAISPDGRLIASGSNDKCVHIWDTQAMQCTINHDHAVTTIDFSPAGGYLASGEHNGIVKIWRYQYITPGDS